MHQLNCVIRHWNADVWKRSVYVGTGAATSAATYGCYFSFGYGSWLASTGAASTGAASTAVASTGVAGAGFIQAATYLSLLGIGGFAVGFLLSYCLIRYVLGKTEEDPELNNIRVAYMDLQSMMKVGLDPSGKDTPELLRRLDKCAKFF